MVLNNKVRNRFSRYTIHELSRVNLANNRMKNTVKEWKQGEQRQTNEWFGWSKFK